MRKFWARFGFFFGVAALSVQFVITMQLSLDAGRGPFLSLIYYFSFFTILTNIAVVLIYLGAIVPGQRWLMPFRRPVNRATAAGAITLVGLFYHFVLSVLWQPQGLFFWCDIALHYVAPVAYLLWYALYNRTGTLSYRNIPQMLVWPVGYVTYIMIRGAFVSEYPYPVLDAGAHGYSQVAQNSLGLLIVFCFLYAAAIAIDRALPSNRSASE